MSLLFSPITMRGLTLPNRIVIAPMCQFSAVDGCATDWHLIHLGHLALSGAGLLVLEATAVEPEGRISSSCLGLYTDAQEAALARVLAVVRRYSTMPLGIQLSHAGRKASIKSPNALGPVDTREWQTVGPSPVAFAVDRRAPQELDRTGMERVIDSFAQAARRAARLGFDMIEIHSAHGYLLSSFLSPIANRRTDDYGGSLQARMRFPLEVFQGLRAAWPADRPLGVRCNGTDWHAEGITPDEAVAYAAALRDLGCDFVDVSTGGNTITEVPIEPGYQVPFSAKVRREAEVPTRAVGLIRDPHHAEAILQRGEADMIALGRGILNEPRWPWHAAEELGATVEVPHPYRRAGTRAGLPTRDHIPVTPPAKDTTVAQVQGARCT
ncbi:MAG: NADH:flavin oxidoreductase/NADH oxidase [Rhodoferax sp.]|nr:NADH:flavin oxidoreductase/NADH oxidase [Rhodoferax sp.]